jgi:hypothetical protein
MQPHVERVYTSERLGSSHGPDIFYEFVYGRVSLGPGHPGNDVVLIRMVYGQTAEDAAPAEIHVKDLTEVQERFNDFMDRVRKKIDPAAQPYAGAAPTGAAPGSDTASLGRYAPDAPRKKHGQPTPAPFAISSGPKKMSLEGAPAISSGPKKGSLGPADAETPSPHYGPLQGLGAPPGAGMEPAQRDAKSYEIISYNLSSPPSPDSLVRTIEGAPAKLVVVARFDLVRKVEDYLKKATEAGGRALPTSDFSTIVVDREKRKPGSTGKLKAALAGGLARMLGTPKAVLWIPPEA